MPGDRDASPEAAAPPFAGALALGVALGLGAMLVVIPALRLSLPTVVLPAPLAAQHQDSETYAFVLAFAVLLPLAGFAGHRLAVRLSSTVGDRALLSIAASLLAGLSLVVLATRGAEAAGLGDSFVWLLALAAAWWLAAAGALGLLLTRDAPARLLPAPRTAWALAGLTGAGAALACVELGSLPLGVLAGGAVLAVAAFAAANRAELPRPSGAWGPAADIAVIGLVVLGVTGVQVISPEDPSLVYERQIIQFHQDFFLGPANEVLHGGAMLVDAFSQYGVGAIYAIAAWFELVGVGNGTLGLFDGLLSALVFAAAYGVLRLAGVSRWLAAVALAVAVIALIYGLLYPWGVAAARGDSVRRPDRRRGRRDARRPPTRHLAATPAARCPRDLLDLGV